MLPPASAQDPADSPGPPAIEVEVSDTQTHLPLAPGQIESLVTQVLDLEGVRAAAISIAVVGNATIHELNRRHLGHDWPTDVITFPLSDPDDHALAGELVVSAEMAVVTATDAGVDPWHELALYLVHGLLHLRGFDDTDTDSAATMRRKEDQVLRSLGLANTFSQVGAGSPERQGGAR